MTCKLKIRLSGPSLRIIFLVLLFVFATVVSIRAQSKKPAPGTAGNQNSLQGKVVTPDGMQPTSPVRVKLTLNGRPIQETFTDLSGRFHFTGLVRGTYQLTAEGDDKTFQTTTVYADLSGSTAQLATQDIQVRPLPGKTLPQAGVISGFTQNVPQAAQQALERANKFIEQAKPPPAIEQLQEAVKIFPEYFEAHLQLGNLFLKEGRFEQAIAELDKAREINPKDERSYQSFGLLLMQQKNFPVAVMVFEEAERLNPTNPMNPVMVGTALVHQASTVEAASSEREKLLTKAEAEWSQAAKLSGDKVKADAFTIASFYEMKDNPGRAADELEQYLKKTQARNAEQIQNEIKRLRAKSKPATQP